jgi:hypothetical protein
MNNVYTNLPPNNVNNQNATLLAFDTYYTKPLEIDAATFDVMRAFFTTRGFEQESAESVAIAIFKQAKQDNYNPLQILDTLKGLDMVEISALVAEIINYNRLKTSFLGYGLEFQSNTEISRNIAP